MIDDNAVGTHEFLNLWVQLGWELCFAGNVGSGAVRELRDWVEYLYTPEGALADEGYEKGTLLES